MSTMHVRWKLARRVSGWTYVLVNVTGTVIGVLLTVIILVVTGQDVVVILWPEMVSGGAAKGMRRGILT